MSSSSDAPVSPDCEEDLPLNDSEEEENSSDFDGPDYGRASYWDDRYARNQTPFDWYQSWAHLYSLLGPFFDGTEIALNIGCGNSPMAVDMGEHFSAVANIDISSVVIEQMEIAYQDRANLLWFTMDCTALDFDNEMFDVAFDKGTLDALFCGSHGIEKVEQALREVCRVLRPRGMFFEVTYGKPESRMPLFEGYGLDWTIHDPVPIRNIERGGWHWIYVFEKPGAVMEGEEAEEPEIGEGERAGETRAEGEGESGNGTDIPISVDETTSREDQSDQ
jgi:ubiquinone/menaquinone biosynthesis C-methylase UbiE